MHAETKSTIMTNEHTSLERYTSHTFFSKGLRKACERLICERWVGDWTNCNILTLSSFVLSSTSFSFCWAAQLESWEPIALCWVLVLSTASYLQLTYSKLTELPVAPGYIIVCRQPTSCGRHICTRFNPSTVMVILWYLLLDAPVPYWVKGQYVAV